MGEKAVICDLFTDEILYTFDKNLIEDLLLNNGADDVPVTPYAKSVDDTKHVLTDNISQISYDTIIIGLDLPVDLTRYMEENFENSYTKSEWADIYLKYIPVKYFENSESYSNTPIASVTEIPSELKTK